MTSQLDMIAVASGDARIPIEAMSALDRIRLFWAVARLLEQYLEGKRGGTGFREWSKENDDRERLGNHALLRYSISIDSSQKPDLPEYKERTRIHVIAAEYWRLPEYDLPDNGAWKKGDECLVVRLCVTNTGRFYLERYETKVSRGSSDLDGQLRLVDKAEYLPLSLCTWNDQGNGDVKLRALFERKPEFLISALYGIRSLMRNDISEKEQALSRTRGYSDKITRVTSLFIP